MIPPLLYPGCPSPGESEIFRRLKDDPGASDWIVLHSLDIANHRKQVAGEADFVVIVPHKGVLCLEVKASKSVSRSGGRWFYGHNPKPDLRGPFKQASEAMHSIRQRLASRKPKLGRVVFWSAVVFPYAPFPAESGEWHPWQVIDGGNFRARPLSALLEQVIDEARTFLETRPGVSWFRPGSGEPTPRQCEEIASALRPDFDFFESPKSMARRRDEELKHYTREQMVALDAMEANPRVVFSGPAGTGKTLLALEAARRARARGHRVLLVCYNRLLGRWLEEQAAELQPGAVATTLHRSMASVLGQGNMPQTPGQNFWEEELPTRAVEKLLDEPQDGFVFDEIVVDEAQDVLREEYLDFLDMSLRGGLAAGRWRMFGDFEYQAIYEAAGMPLQEFLAERARNVPVYSLRANCRNTPRVAEYAHLLGGLEPRYSTVRRQDDGVKPELLYYKDKRGQQELLARSLEKLHQEGFKGRDIAVLSTRADGASCAASIDAEPWKDRLRPAGKASAGRTGYCSIHAFKGMEAPAVVVTDVQGFGDPASTALFYVGVTRALDRLVILVHEPVKKRVVDTLTGLPGGSTQ